MKKLIEHLNEAATDKDFQRVWDIHRKSKGNQYDQRRLSYIMANKIKDKEKAKRRYEAALQSFGDHDESPITDVFLKHALYLGADISVGKTKKQINLDNDLEQLKIEVARACEDFRTPKSLFTDKEIYSNYPLDNKSDKFIRFDNPWALYFWNHNMIGQMSDGYWENSKVYRDEWKYYIKRTPIYDPNAKLDEWEGNHPNPLYVTKYALQTKDDIIKFGKVYQMNEKSLLPIISDYYMKADDVILEKVKSVERAKSIADEFNIDYNLYLVLLGQPELPEKTVMKIVRQAHKDIQRSMML